jgi:uncharacterized protein DUF1259
VGNVVIKPALALMAWAAFIKSGNNAVTYGDLVVLEDEINPVIVVTSCCARRNSTR